MIGQSRSASCTGNTRLSVDDNGVRLDEILREERRQLKNGRRRVTARRGDQFGLGDLFTMKFGQSIDRLLEQIGMSVRRLVPALVGSRIFEAIVSAQIDDELSSAHARGDRCQ